jgi:hypothetical protein
MEGRVARLSSAALAQAAMRHAPAQLRPFDGPHRAALNSTWIQAQEAAPGLWPAEVADLSAALQLNALAPAQQAFAIHQAQAAFDSLLQAEDPSTSAGQISLARLRSVASPGASAWLEALPAARCLTLSDPEFRAAMRRRLGLPSLPRGAPTVTCFCGAPLSATDTEHAHTCPTPSALRVLRHDNLVEVVRRAMRRGGVSSSKEPLLAALQSGALAHARAPRLNARGDILFVLDAELCVADVSIIHPGASTYRQAAAATAGAAAAIRDTAKRAQYRTGELSAYRFVPLSAETFGRLGKPFMALLSQLGDLAVTRGDGLLSKEQFVSGVIRELSVSLCKTNARLEHGVGGYFVKASGVCLRHGRSRPTAEVSDLD